MLPNFMIYFSFSHIKDTIALVNLCQPPCKAFSREFFYTYFLLTTQCDSWTGVWCITANNTEKFQHKKNEKAVLLCFVICHYGTYHKLHRHHQGNKSPALPEESTVPLYVLTGSGFADLLPILAYIL
jgi:hypothetical protein